MSFKSTFKKLEDQVFLVSLRGRSRFQGRSRFKNSRTSKFEQLNDGDENEDESDDSSSSEDSAISEQTEFRVGDSTEREEDGSPSRLLESPGALSASTKDSSFLNDDDSFQPLTFLTMADYRITAENKQRTKSQSSSSETREPIIEIESVSGSSEPSSSQHSSTSGTNTPRDWLIPQLAVNSHGDATLEKIQSTDPYDEVSNLNQRHDKIISKSMLDASSARNNKHRKEKEAPTEDPPLRVKRKLKSIKEEKDGTTRGPKEKSAKHDKKPRKSTKAASSTEKESEKQSAKKKKKKKKKSTKSKTRSLAPSRNESFSSVNSSTSSLTFSLASGALMNERSNSQRSSNRPQRPTTTHEDGPEFIFDEELTEDEDDNSSSSDGVGNIETVLRNHFEMLDSVSDLRSQEDVKERKVSYLKQPQQDIETDEFRDEEEPPQDAEIEDLGDREEPLSNAEREEEPQQNVAREGFRDWEEPRQDPKEQDFAERHEEEQYQQDSEKEVFYDEEEQQEEGRREDFCDIEGPQQNVEVQGLHDDITPQQLAGAFKHFEEQFEQPQEDTGLEDSFEERTYESPEEEEQETEPIYQMEDTEIGGNASHLHTMNAESADLMSEEEFSGPRVGDEKEIEPRDFEKEQGIRKQKRRGNKRKKKRRPKSPVDELIPAVIYDIYDVEQPPLTVIAKDKEVPSGSQSLAVPSRDDNRAESPLTHSTALTPTGEIVYFTGDDNAKQPLTGHSRRRKTLLAAILSNRMCCMIFMVNIMLVILLGAIGTVLLSIVIDRDGDGDESVVIGTNSTDSVDTLVPTTFPSPTAAPTSSPAPTLSIAPTVPWNSADWIGSLRDQKLGSAIAVGGNMVAFASNGSLRNEVRIYQQRPDGDGWRLLGSPVTSGEGQDGFGSRVVLSSTGERAVVGAPDGGVGKIYTYDYNEANDEWLLSAILEGIKTFVDPSSNAIGSTQLGTIFDLSGDGDILATGEPLFARKSGRVLLYKFDSGQWNQLNLQAPAVEQGDEFGSSVSLSADGKTIAIGSSGRDGSSRDGGSVTLLRFTQGVPRTTSVIGKNAPISGVIASQGFGQKVALSSDGRLVVISSLNGNIRAYLYNTEIGFWLDILETSEFNPNQFAISQYPGGYTVAFTYTDCPEGQTCEMGPLGFVRVLQYENRRWSRTSEEDLVGLPVGNGSLTLDASKNGDIAVGIPSYAVDNVQNAGLVQVYDNINP